MARERSWHSIPEYNALRAMIQAGTTSGAAQRLGLSQSAVSRSITSLENRLGAMLFEREAGRLRPTQEAIRLNRRLDPLFEALDHIDGPSEPVQETLRLIAPPSFAHRYLVSLIDSFLTTFPNFFVSFEVNTSDEVTRGVLDGRFDLGITAIEMSRAGVILQPFRESEAVCVMSKDHELAGRDQITPVDLDGRDMIAFSYRHARRGQFERLLHQCRSRPRLVAEVSTSFAAADLARAGRGIGVVNPFPLYHARSDDLAFVRFVSPLRYRSHFVISDRGPIPRPARSFMRHLRMKTPRDPFSRNC